MQSIFIPRHISSRATPVCLSINTQTKILLLELRVIIKNKNKKMEEEYAFMQYRMLYTICKINLLVLREIELTYIYGMCAVLF